MITEEAIFRKIIKDPRYQDGIHYGKPRRGHAEGTIQAHIEELEKNLMDLNSAGRIPPDYYWKLKLLIHVHDTFKGEGHKLHSKNVAIEDPTSHASLARQFLSNFTSDNDLLFITQYHDIGYAVYRKYKAKGVIDSKRLMGALDTIGDLDVFLTFAIIDSCTASKGREMIRWLINEVNRLYPNKSKVTEDWILPGPETIGDVW